MIQPFTWMDFESYSGKAWTAIGPLVGVLVGGYIATRSQLRHWVLDSRRAEYRELFSTLTKSYSTIVNLHSLGIMSGDDELKVEMARLDALNVIRDRVVIGRELRDMKLVDKWAAAVTHFLAKRDYRAFAAEFAAIMDSLRQTAETLIQ